MPRPHAQRRPKIPSSAPGTPTPQSPRKFPGRGALALFVSALMLLAPRVHAADAAPPDAPMSPDARAHYDRGLALYQAKDYAGAIREFEVGYAAEPRREFLFAEAQAKRLAGDCVG